VWLRLSDSLALLMVLGVKLQPLGAPATNVIWGRPARIKRGRRVFTGWRGTVALTDRVRVVACRGDPSSPSRISVVRWMTLSGICDAATTNSASKARHQRLRVAAAFDELAEAI
jgi:hypothetical protein